MRAFILLFVLIFNLSQAQVKGKFRVNFDVGKVLSTNNSGNFSGYIEPKYFINKDLSLGFRTGLALVYRRPKFDKVFNFNAGASTSLSYLATLDYYPKFNTKYFKPYIGIGAGIYSVDKVNIDFTGDTALNILKDGLSPLGDNIANLSNLFDINNVFNLINSFEEKTNEVLVNNLVTVDSGTKFGFLLKTGIESGRFRFGFEYNFVPSSTLTNNSGNTVGTATNSYFGLNLGFYLGGGSIK